MSANPPAAAAAPAKSKKMLIIIIAVLVLVLAGGGAAAFFLMGKKNAEDEEGAEPVRKEAPKVAPTFLPMENMVVNLADPGGDRFVQIGITVEVADAKTAEQVKQYMPSIRSGVLLLVSQRTSAELLQREGKEKLAHDILREVSKPLGYTVPAKKARKESAAEGEESEEDDRAARRKAAQNPVQRILFSSFIIQ